MSDLMQCSLEAMVYDFVCHAGVAHFPDGKCCDMSGCIAFFEKIDPKVVTIQTYSGAKPDVLYRKRAEGWTAHLVATA
jgi:hypothetical protein